MTLPFDPLFPDLDHRAGLDPTKTETESTDAARLLVLWDRLHDHHLRRVLEHWIAARGGAVIPARARIDPARFAGCLSRVWIFRLQPDGDFLCTLAGETINSAWGRTIMNRSAREILGDAHEPIVNSRWRAVLGRPAIMHAVSPRVRGRPAVEHLVLPVADGSGEPIQVLGVTVFAADPPQPPICETRTDATLYPLERSVERIRPDPPADGADESPTAPSTGARSAFPPPVRRFHAPHGSVAWGVREYP